ncbi:MAG: CPBP family intramembrane metalloprotease [Clostridia bacterium]|nr:CPBP family intramembrane metalloprotease [Clostridia bacterium]
MSTGAGIRVVSVHRRGARGEPTDGPGIRGAPGTALLLHALLSLLLQFCWYLLPDGTLGLDKQGLTGYVVAIVLMQGLCVLLPALLTIWWHGIPGRLVTGHDRVGSGTVLLAFMLGIPSAVMLLSLNNIAVYLLARTGMTLPRPILPAEYDAQGSMVILVVLLASALLPALLEEIMFRGVIQPSMTASGGRLSAVVLTAVAFAVYHSDPLFVVAPLGAGLILGYLRLHVDSLFPCIAAHLSLNTTWRLIRPLLPRLTAGYLARYAQSAEPVLNASLAAFLLSAAVAVPLALLTVGAGRRQPHSAAPAVYPADGRFLLATLLLVATMIVAHYATATP